MEQVGGTHYSNKPIQPIEFIERNKLSFSVGNVVKYITRWKEKGGLQDLLKANQYVSFIRRYNITVPKDQPLSVEDYLAANKVGYFESVVLRELMKLQPTLSITDREGCINHIEKNINSLVHSIENKQEPSLEQDLNRKCINLSSTKCKSGKRL